jgi:hypothetical protein
VDDPHFAGVLRERLMTQIAHAGVAVDAKAYMSRPITHRALEWVALTLTRIALIVQGQRYL